MKRHALVIGYAILVLLIVLGAFRLETTANQVELEALRRSHVLCVGINDLRADIQSYLRDRPALPEPPEDIDPALLEYFEQLRERDRGREDRLARFERLECPPSPDGDPG